MKCWILLVATRDIAKGERLHYDYNVVQNEYSQVLICSCCNFVVLLRPYWYQVPIGIFSGLGGGLNGLDDCLGL